MSHLKKSLVILKCLAFFMVIVLILYRWSQPRPQSVCKRFVAEEPTWDGDDLVWNSEGGCKMHNYTIE